MKNPPYPGKVIFTFSPEMMAPSKARFPKKVPRRKIQKSSPLTRT